MILAVVTGFLGGILFTFLGALLSRWIKGGWSVHDVKDDR